MEYWSFGVMEYWSDGVLEKLITVFRRNSINLAVRSRFMWEWLSATIKIGFYQFLPRPPRLSGLR